MAPAELRWTYKQLSKAFRVEFVDLTSGIDDIDDGGAVSPPVTDDSHTSRW